MFLRNGHRSFQQHETDKTADRVRPGARLKMPVPTAGRRKTRPASCQQPTPMYAPGLLAPLATSSLSVVQLSVQIIRSCFGLPVRAVASSSERTGLLWIEEDRYSDVDARWSTVPGFIQGDEDEAGHAAGNQGDGGGDGGNFVRPVSSRRSSAQPPTYGTPAPKRGPCECCLWHGDSNLTGLHWHRVSDTLPATIVLFASIEATYKATMTYRLLYNINHAHGPILNTGTITDSLVMPGEEEQAFRRRSKAYFVPPNIVGTCNLSVYWINGHNFPQHHVLTR